MALLRFACIPRVSQAEEKRETKGTAKKGGGIRLTTDTTGISWQIVA